RAVVPGRAGRPPPLPGGIGARVHRPRFAARGMGRADAAHGDLAAIGYQDSLHAHPNRTMSSPTSTSSPSSTRKASTVPEVSALTSLKVFITSISAMV